MTNHSVILCILDGWGNNKNSQFNAIAQADTPYWDSIISQYPQSNIVTHGPDVGLPDRQIGNSEVGHISLGSGRIVLQDLCRINEEIKNIRKNTHLLEFTEQIKRNNGICHIAGLLSDGGIHSSLSHILDIIDALSYLKIQVVIHIFLDGRDTPPISALKYINILCSHIKDLSNVSIATISGRYYSMDRDNRLDRTTKAYNSIAFGHGKRYEDPISAVQDNYNAGITDEFIIPCVIGNYQGMNPTDGFIMTNFRSDRVIQILKMITEDQNTNHITLKNTIGMIKYSNELNIPCLFPNKKISNTLGEIISNQQLHQLRIAETEKYAHVTFFFNGGREEVFENEERIIIPSPSVTTYDLVPEMSAYEITDTLIKKINLQKYSLIIINYANADMVGHTGNIEATKKAITTLDQCLGKILKCIHNTNYILVITADHGNAEEMFDVQNNMPYTAHTLNPVPFVVCNYPKKIKLKNGRLSDVAPTILEILNIKQPEEMTGISLIDTSN
ncbi:2,3-bisphosphoglycerate-independent phosphoglycerate mutase [Ehrlichia ruminantium]|uniref:2,3-bisphosphoglycerate-independent phosphoglycerate mutase n=1 Tax=Ehrlichia ruminantium TaxID=779 RepID=UPI0015DBE5E1|nr:2,3-bisphosphoglycerate-independent phosphoglycerate mutase [Ehrlichia ruminantium]QLK50593.1 2,3-bisphosphoglycerate-independent phosphoglycerate mutase [Ehrlichia ruminantium]QLK51518.1 2,3-bisphosphoglycerate-independent phosphoglycerate mutase [Ehrlichia ruminantium]